MKIHVLTLSWNGREKLLKLRPGLCAGLMRITHSNGKLKDGFESPEWYIRDNGSKDGTVDEIKRWASLSDCPIPTTVFDVDHNRDSFAQGMNFLFERTKAADDDVILLLNNDVVIEDANSLKNMFNLMNNTRAGVVGARLLYPGGGRLQHAGVIFSNRYGNMPFHFRPNEEADDNSRKNRYFQAVTAAVCMVRAGSYRRVGGMDEGFRWAFEDIDLCLRIGQTEKIAYCGETVILHEESATLKKNPVQKMFMISNVARFKNKWWDGQNPRYLLDHQAYLNNSSHNEIKDK